MSIETDRKWITAHLEANLIDADRAIDILAVRHGLPWVDATDLVDEWLDESQDATDTDSTDTRLDAGGALAEEVQAYFAQYMREWEGQRWGYFQTPMRTVAVDSSPIDSLNSPIDFLRRWAQ